MYCAECVYCCPPAFFPSLLANFFVALHKVLTAAPHAPGIWPEAQLYIYNSLFSLFPSHTLYHSLFISYLSISLSEFSIWFLLPLFLSLSFSSFCLFPSPSLFPCSALYPFLIVKIRFLCIRAPSFCSSLRLSSLLLFFYLNLSADYSVCIFPPLSPASFLSQMFTVYLFTFSLLLSISSLPYLSL